MVLTLVIRVCGKLPKIDEVVFFTIATICVLASVTPKKLPISLILSHPPTEFCTCSGTCDTKCEVSLITTGPTAAIIVPMISTTPKTETAAVKPGRFFLLSIWSILLASGFIATARKIEIPMIISASCAWTIKNHTTASAKITNQNLTKVFVSTWIVLDIWPPI